MVHWGTAMFAISLSTNIFVTAAIASRIWYVNRPMSISVPAATATGSPCLI